ncbi:hypothetical protein I4F81_006160 [Pyropia yezoensis]|uniref:Uncharacterized protein n=1 Tax=Pyropia yezoensis TaxID=2788 RepID=A0ACC3C0Y4_PYRYE|nr:hypothetical protein I4F81_006160 [Neopyropia yezoensis]
MYDGDVGVTAPAGAGAPSPGALPCREAEMDELRDFVAAATAPVPAGRSLYISGVPGTGKTATVRAVLAEAVQAPAAPPARPLRVVEVNGMALPDPAAAYSALYEAMDALVTRRPRVLFDLLEWPTRSASALAVIGISNTMDLPERLLLPRLASRLGVGRLIYMPYTSAQLTTILRAALPDRAAKDLTAASTTEASLAALAPAELLAAAAVAGRLRASGLPAMAARDLPAAVAALHARASRAATAARGGGKGGGG